MTPEPPPLIKHTRGRRRSVYTDLHYRPNNDCEYYGWPARGNICGNGHPNSGKWRQLKCIMCEKYFTETLGTPFYRSKTSPNTIISALKALAEGLGIQATARVFDVDADTVQDWLKQGSEHIEAISRYPIHDLHLTQVQVDELWSLLGERDELAPQKRNIRWIWSATDSKSKLWLGFLVADRSLEAAQVFIHRVAQLLIPGCIPLFLSDRWKPYAIAILTRFGHWVDISSECSKESVRNRIRQTIGNMINTSFVERMNLTLRHHVPALARRTIQIT